MERQYFPKVNRTSIAIWGMVALMLLMLISSFTENGAFSSSYSPVSSMFVPFSIFLSMYLLIIWGMRFVGLNPTRFELIFLPTILIAMLFIGLSLTDSIIAPDDDDDESTSTNSEPPSATSVGDNTQTQDSNPPLTDQGTQTNDREAANNEFSELLKYIGLFVVVVILIIGIIYLYRMREDDSGDFHFARPIEYSRPLGENQQSIIEYYINSSLIIEKFKGRAPKWFSPTYFSTHVQSQPGPPLSSYFDRLTNLYELARFSEKDLSMDYVIEAKELSEEIHRGIEDLFNALKSEVEHVS